MKSLSLWALVLAFSSLIYIPVSANDEFEEIEAELKDRAVVLQLPDGVRRIRLSILDEEGAWQTVGPSPIGFAPDWHVPQELDSAGMDQVVIISDVDDQKPLVYDEIGRLLARKKLKGVYTIGKHIAYAYLRKSFTVNARSL